MRRLWVAAKALGVLSAALPEKFVFIRSVDGSFGFGACLAACRTAMRHREPALVSSFPKPDPGNGAVEP